jgi:pimeloyl-ACP methyl ester carboxylesterase
MALRSDTAAATTVRDLVMSNVQLWTYRANPAQPLAPPAIGRLGEVTAPALVILGGQDLPHIAEIGRLLLTGIRGARLTTIPGAGHIVNLDAREAFNAAMMAFLPAR